MNVATIKTQITTLQAALTTAIASPGPNYTISSPAGSRTISKADYIKSLIDDISALQLLLVQVEPYRIQTQTLLVP